MLIRILLFEEAIRLRKNLETLLADPHLLITTMAKKKKLWSELGRQPFDLVIVMEKSIEGPIESLVDTARNLPDRPEVVVVSEQEDPDKRALLLAAGCYAVLYGGLSSEPMTVALGALINRRREEIREKLNQPNRFGFQTSLQDFVSSSPVMQNFMSVVYRIVPTDSSLLILGETGVGKERLARAIHNEGPRSREPFIIINCAAIPETLLESELFGHEEGAFTGAVRARRGHFELAHEGTIFLDEIGELPLHLQAKLLQVLQERSIRPIGSEKTVGIDIRVIAATNRDLEEEVTAERFREDLYYRLSVVALDVPPLRERREDIPELIESYVEHFYTHFGWPVKKVKVDAQQALIKYDWPGNVRELINVIERSIILSKDDEITLDDLPVGIAGTISINENARSRPFSFGMEQKNAMDRWLALPWKEARDEMLEQFEKEYFQEQLRSMDGRIGETAKRAGIASRSVHEKMKRHGLKKEDFKH